MIDIRNAASQVRAEPSAKTGCLGRSAPIRGVSDSAFATPFLLSRVTYSNWVTSPRSVAAGGGCCGRDGFRVRDQRGKGHECAGIPGKGQGPCGNIAPCPNGRVQLDQKASGCCRRGALITCPAITTLHWWEMCWCAASRLITPPARCQAGPDIRRHQDGPKRGFSSQELDKTCTSSTKTYEPS